MSDFADPRQRRFVSLLASEIQKLFEGNRAPSWKSGENGQHHNQALSREDCLQNHSLVDAMEVGGSPRK